LFLRLTFRHELAVSDDADLPRFPKKRILLTPLFSISIPFISSNLFVLHPGTRDAQIEQIASQVRRVESKGYPSTIVFPATCWRGCPGPINWRGSRDTNLLAFDSHAVANKLSENESRQLSSRLNVAKLIRETCNGYRAKYYRILINPSVTKHVTTTDKCKMLPFLKRHFKSYDVSSMDMPHACATVDGLGRVNFIGHYSTIRQTFGNPRHIYPYLSLSLISVILRLQRPADLKTRSDRPQDTSED